MFLGAELEVEYCINCFNFWKGDEGWGWVVGEGVPGRTTPIRKVQQIEIFSFVICKHKQGTYSIDWTISLIKKDPTE